MLKMANNGVWTVCEQFQKKVIIMRRN